jgi:sugar-specific transcriptional regulator TrmB
MKPYLRLVTIAGNRKNAAASAASGVALTPQSLSNELRRLGLRPYAARLLAALLYGGPGNSAALAERSGVPRTSVYSVADGLVELGLVVPVPTTGPAVWASAGWAEVVDALDAAEEERVRLHRTRTERLRGELAEVFRGSMSA